MRSDPGACVWPSRSTSAARRRSAASTPSIRSTRGSRRSGRRRRSHLRADSGFRRLRAEGGLRGAARAVGLRPDARGRGQRHRAAARTRTAACSSIAASSTTTRWTGANLKNDRARAAVDNFKALDGAFDDNVILQIKHGPIDFQVREPASPLFGDAATDEPGDRAADHAGVSRTAAPPRLPAADVEGGARLRHAGQRGRARR